MEGPAKFTPEQIEKNKTREVAADRIVTEGGGTHINDRGEVEIIASEKTKNDAQGEMNHERNNEKFYEKYRNLIGKNIQVVFTKDLDSAAPTAFFETGWLSFTRNKGKLKEIDAVLKDISSGVAVLEFEGKEVEAFAPGIKEMHLID